MLPFDDPELELETWEEIRQHRINSIKKAVEVVTEELKSLGASDDAINVILRTQREFLSRLSLEAKAES